MKTKLLSLPVLVAILLLSAFGPVNKPADRKYYQVGLLWIKNPAKFQEYAQKAFPMLPKDAGMVVSVQPSTSSMGSKTPHSFSVTHYASKELHDNFFFKNEDYLALVPIRDEGADAVVINGYDTEYFNYQPAREAMVSGAYDVQLIQGDMSKKAFEKFEKVYNEFNGHIIKVLKTDVVSVGEFERPALVEIVHFNSMDDLNKMKASEPYKKLLKKGVARDYLSGKAPQRPGM